MFKKILFPFLILIIVGFIAVIAKKLNTFFDAAIYTIVSIIFLFIANIIKMRARKIYVIFKNIASKPNGNKNNYIGTIISADILATENTKLLSMLYRIGDSTSGATLTMDKYPEVTENLPEQLISDVPIDLFSDKHREWNIPLQNSLQYYILELIAEYENEGKINKSSTFVCCKTDKNGVLDVLRVKD